MPIPPPPCEAGSVTVSVSPSAIEPAAGLTMALPASDAALRRKLIDLLLHKDGFDPDYSSCSTPQLHSMMHLAERMPVMIDEQYPAVTRSAVLDLLADFADFLQVSVPGDAGIDLYLAGLEHLPAPLLRMASTKLAGTHRFNRLPLPADFARTIESEVEELQSAKRGWQSNITRLSRAYTRRK